MKRDFFDVLQNRVKSGEITVQEAVEKSAIFVQKNFTVFGLETRDDDFKSNIIIAVLQRGHTVFERYNKDFGSFFTYFYSFVKGLILTETKLRAKQKINDKVDMIHSLEYLFEIEEKNDFTLVVEDSMCVPYANKPFTKPELERTVKDFMAKRGYKRFAKSVLVIALKACYDITEDEIDLICNEFGVNKDNFYETIQKLKNNLENKKNRRNEVIGTRNNAYYSHMKYSEVFAGNLLSTEYIKHEYEVKFNINTKRWMALNSKLYSGLYHLSPTNKAVADVLGISERQVEYYISKFKKEIDQMKNTSAG